MTIHVTSAEKALPSFASQVMQQPHLDRLYDAEAEIGEAVDFVAHVERQPGRRILRKCAEAWCIQGPHETLSDRFGLGGPTCSGLEQRTRRISPPTFSVIAAWNPGAFRLYISALVQMLSSRAIRCESVPASTRTPRMIGRGGLRELAMEMVRRSSDQRSF